MVTFRTNEHCFVAGKTRSGKTVLIQSIVNKLSRCVIHDRKHEMLGFAQQYHYAICSTPDQLTTLLQKAKKRILYMPADPSVEDFNEVCRIIFYTGNISFVVDEAASYCPTSAVPYWAGELLRLGSGKGIGVISLVQRPRDVSNVLLSESSVVICFRLQLLTDRQKISATVGPEVTDALRTLPKYHFMLYSADDEHVYWCSPIRVK